MLLDMDEKRQTNKLMCIQDLHRSFPFNREVTKYHAIFLIQTILKTEIDAYSQKHTISKRE